MSWFKKTELKDVSDKYGCSHKGIFAKEPIKRGEAIFTCNPSECDYLKQEDLKLAKTGADMAEVIAKYPESADFIIKYSYMADDDIYDWPKGYVERTLVEDCMFFNHSCDSNCGFGSLDECLVVAIRDINCGEELTYDYQFMDTEASNYAGIVCKCGSPKCVGVLRFDRYRNIDWQKKYYKYCGAYVQRKIDEMKTRWYSAECYLKHYNDFSDKKSRILGLTALEKIRKDEMIAVFCGPITPDNHYLRHSEKPTCYVLDNGEVYTIGDLDNGTELTIDFNGIQ